MQEYSHLFPFAFIIGLVVLGLLTKRFSLWDKFKTNGSDIEQWFAASRLRTFGVPALASVVLVLGFFLIGQTVLIAKIFANAFVFFILFNVVYRLSGRHQYRLGVSVAFLFTFFGSIMSLILFYMGGHMPL